MKSRVPFLYSLLAAVVLLAGCTTTPTVSSGGPWEVPVGSAPPGIPKRGGGRGPTAAPARPDGVIYPVWFGTNRKPVATPRGHEFTAEPYDRTTYGRVEVFVPKSHRFGETTNPYWRRLMRGTFSDDSLKVEDIRLLGNDAFYAEVRQAIAQAMQASPDAQALVFLHGFNVTFEEAAIRAAQVGFDLKVPGPTAFFSWPSAGRPTPTDYIADELAIAASESTIADFLVEFAEKCGAANINLIAHSMGNRGLLGALQRIAADAEKRGKVKFNQIFLAAPDVSRKQFLEVAGVYAEFSKRTTLYASNGDLPVYLSTIINAEPRAGYFRPYTITPGVDTIAVPDFDVDMLGHSYFAQAEALLYDIQTLMLSNKAPGARIRTFTTQEEGRDFWELRR
jgi:esterase/lipase superfamily enzyme